MANYGRSTPPSFVHIVTSWKTFTFCSIRKTEPQNRSSMEQESGNIILFLNDPPSPALSKKKRSSQCNFLSFCPNELKDQPKIHIGKKMNKCNHCNFVSSQASNLRDHLKKHSGKNKYKCNQCDYASSQAVHLRTHMKTHNQNISNKCNQCDYASSWAGNLRKHLKMHNG